MKGKKRSIGFTYAWNGVMKVIKNERNFQIHLIATLLVVVASLYLNLLLVEWAILFLAIGSVLVTEVINTVVEELIDYFKPDLHPTAKKIKDMAAGAVLIAAIHSIIIGLLIFVPKIYELF